MEAKKIRKNSRQNCKSYYEEPCAGKPHARFWASVCFCKFPESGEWIRKCIEILDECIQLQVTSDGFHRLQSKAWIREALNYVKEKTDDYGLFT